MPWYQSKPHIWRNFLVFVAISQIWHIKIRPNSHRLSVLELYLTIWRVSRKSYIRNYRYMPWYHSQPHIWIYFLVFVVISQIWHIKICPNSHRLSVLGYLTIWRVSRKSYCRIKLKIISITLDFYNSFVESPSEKCLE